MQQAAPTTPDIRLFRHAKRPSWGVAAFLWERDQKRGYQFSDGKMRVFKEGYYHLFEPARAPGDGSAKAVRRAARMARADSVTAAKRLPTLRDQITMFRRNFPDGFVGEAWTKKYRGKGARKRLKRHRDAALDDARELDVAELRPVLDERDWPEVYERLLKLASSTSLVTPAHVKKLRALTPTRELAVAVYEWLECPSLDDDDASRRFNNLVRQLGAAATWPVVSVIGGLVEPTRHTCVRPSVFKQQGTMLVADFEVKSRPWFGTYRRYVEMAKTVFAELEAAGLQPRDLIDVYDFIWETLRPAARDELLSQWELPPLESEQGESEQAEVEAKPDAEPEAEAKPDAEPEAESDEEDFAQAA